MELDENGKMWLIRHYKHTKNRDIIARFGITYYRLRKYAQELGLKKSLPFMRKVMKECSERGVSACREKGWPPKGYVIPNQEKRIENLHARKGQKRRKKSVEKYRLTMESLRKSERRRVLFGLEQKTRMKVVRAPKRKIHIRNKMRGLGYRIEKGGNTAYCDASTRRSAYFEREAGKYGIDIVFEE